MVSNVSEPSDTAPEVVVQQQPQPKTLTHLISGASAGLISAISLQPFDLLKTRLQQQQRSNLKYRTTISKELKKLTHIKDLWRGALPSTLRTSVGAGLYFTILSSARNGISDYKRSSDSVSDTSVLPKLSPFENLATGFIVRAVVGIITMPITIVKTRYESNIYNYNSMYEGFENIYLDGNQKGQGSLKNFFKGSFATLARDCPYAGMYVLFYESFKNDILTKIVPPINETENGPITRSTIINTSAAILAASVSTTITAPFDAIKTRLQLSSIVASKKMTLWSATKDLMREDGGVKNLFRGLSLRFGRKGLSSGISWCIYEELIKSNFAQVIIAKSDKKLV